MYSKFKDNKSRQDFELQFLFPVTVHVPEAWQDLNALLKARGWTRCLCRRHNTLDGYYWHSWGTLRWVKRLASLLYFKMHLEDELFTTLICVLLTWKGFEKEKCFAAWLWFYYDYCCFLLYLIFVSTWWIIFNFVFTVQCGHCLCKLLGLGFLIKHIFIKLFQFCIFWLSNLFIKTLRVWMQCFQASAKCIPVNLNF